MRSKKPLPRGEAFSLNARVIVARAAPAES